MQDNQADRVDPSRGNRERSIGAIIAETRHLTAEQVESVVAYQKKHAVRFGEAAVAMGVASADDVIFALAQQYNYPLASDEQRQLSQELVALNKPFSRQVEAFRDLRSQLIMRVDPSSEGARRPLAVVSPDVGDGKTFVAANLAITLAQLGGRTLLVDADLRSPRLHEVFGLKNGAGLSNILSGRAENQVIQQATGVPNLFVLPVGPTPPNPVELVERPAFGLLLNELISKFDHVVVDTPAAAYGSDAAVIAARCGAVLVVARRDESRVKTLQHLTMLLQQSRSKILGVLYNEH
ncbi:polysaccharide biosynthesis tyrosine autokinase [Roseateles sp.]|uniref:polysaccharide biosynthesis tyrosine autokinase n=1 Tax=Roseateles sp. TaxID=1971397 RepID=UPI003BAD0B74